MQSVRLSVLDVSHGQCTMHRTVAETTARLAGRASGPHEPMQMGLTQAAGLQVLQLSALLPPIAPRHTQIACAVYDIRAKMQRLKHPVYYAGKQLLRFARTRSVCDCDCHPGLQGGACGLPTEAEAR